MNKRLIVITFCLVFVLFAGYQVKHRFDAQQTFSKNDIAYGAAGKDVYELQGRLKYLGFYYGSVDGDFGYNTLRSLKWFQSEFGLNVDGIAGSKTKLKLWEATKDYKPAANELPPTTGNAGAGQTGGGEQAGSPPANMTSSNHLGLSQQDLDMMANAVYGESRGEPYIGQVAVAAVILNRVHSPSFPNTVSGVIFQPGAFTAVADGQIWLTPNDTAKRAVQDALNGTDPTGGCLYYFNPETATSKWIWTRPQVKQIGKHIFCK
ncbi:spore cortex-lytic enzyme [Paenibacillus doosanensis]|uniref:Spore cortex-lytic enzyme n=1 Tax=Paenibacillus konkukensis TaxID=2020716 RepID=A0ABY4S0B4_9BACL|nr:MULTISPECIES: spore cortex-lytic enzyme [Paenibacillus]MCS7461832.1 spore cortex-lytic enzyme [Paenibacillus doosanensis]UQZ87400.1 Spore cortex-lytic enzyme precursor [Paenibacillus konkukensis]